ncbi:hypothetical protein [Acidiphilium acidophilum]|uniref:Uncharacterized protein n=1 Tax=Acidiphilium acidophilum TaxID=76588 RepID=A0AAW9DSH6_ACIAO|nr:hypothetical protein [Acidiphilium acidophilum]MDX5931591.1 hypothetical protein [Acidiphilium acidophilum]
MNKLSYGAALALLLAVSAAAPSASAQTPGVGNGSPQTSGMNNAAVSGGIPGMDAGRSVTPPAGIPAGEPRPGSMNGAAVTGHFSGFKAGRLPARRVGSTRDMNRPTGGMNNEGVSGGLPGMTESRTVSHDGN